MKRFNNPVFETLGTITSFSLEAVGQHVAALSGEVVNSGFWKAASGIWQTANQALFVPFVLTKPVTFVIMFHYNGLTVSGNIDVGIYNLAGKRIVSIGGVAQAGGSAIQTFDIADTRLGPGTFYMALVLDNIVGCGYRSSVPGTGGAALVGMATMANAYPLPPVAVLTSCLSNYVYLFGMHTRTLI